ncbi:MAG: type II secretion system F family protein [Planctomycetes bacterium]|nr:type II secretion system F family protein [Planctomycetota bacterium]
MSQLTFHYKAIDQRGAKSKGVLRAANRREAYRQISASGLKPLRIIAQRSEWRPWRSAPVGARDLAHLTYQFAVLMEARIPIADGLRSIAEQEPNRRLGRVIQDIAAQIESGQSVTDSLASHRELFGEVYVETVRAAEASGNMAKVLGRLAEMLEAQYETTKNVKGALMYPLCVVIALAGAVTFLMMVVIPKFAALFATRGIDLPLLTQLLMGISEFVRTYWYLLLAGLVGGGWTVWRAWRTPRSRQRIDDLLHKVPFLRDVLRGMAVSRFAHVFGLSLQSGLGLIEALEMSGRSSGRPLLQADTERMRDQVKQGGRLADILLACAYLPGFARRLIAAGEEAGELPRMCEIVARHYDREVAHLTRNLATLIEPVVIVGLAAIVLMFALAVFLPMWNMGALIG